MKKLLLAASLLFAVSVNPALALTVDTPLPACQTLDTIKQINSDIPDLVYVAAPPWMLAVLKSAWDKAGQTWPDEITTVQIGLTEHYADQVFLFAFSDKGCFNFLTHIDKTHFTDIIGKGA